MLQQIHQIAKLHGSRPALVDGTGETIDYATLERYVSAAAARIRDAHGDGGFVVVKPATTVMSVVTVLGAMASGNTVVPVAPATQGPQLDYIIQKCGGASLVDESSRDDLEGEARGVDAGDSRDPAMILFTSGTTGDPKGVIVTLANLEHSCREIAAYLDYPVHASAAVVLPLYYSYSLISQVFAQLYSGGTVHLFPTLRNPIKVSKAINERGIKVFSGVPSTFVALKMFHGMHPLCMPDVKVVCSAGAPYDLQLHGAVREIFPNARVFNNYGATEATPRISFVADDDSRFFDGSCGRAIPGLEVVAVDQASGMRLPEGENGIIAVKGPNVTPGYLNDPEKTAAAFTPDGFFLTNDIGCLREGLIYVSGRADDIFDVGGEKVSPGEIEKALMSLPGIERSAVVGRRDPERGNVPVAFVKLSGATTKAELNNQLSRLIAPIKVPVRYYRVDRFPETPNGKLKRRDLQANEAEYMQHEIS